MRCSPSLKRIAKCLQARSILAVGTFIGAAMSDVKAPCAAAKSSSFPPTATSPAWAEIETPAVRAKTKDDTRRIFCIIGLLPFRLDRAIRGQAECRGERFLHEPSVRKRCVKIAKAGCRSHPMAPAANDDPSPRQAPDGRAEPSITGGNSGIFPVRQMSFPGNGHPGIYKDLSSFSGPSCRCSSVSSAPSQSCSS